VLCVITTKTKMKKKIEIAFLLLALTLAPGCGTLEKATGWALQEEVSTQVVNGQEITSTNWVVKPQLENGIRITGALAPGAGNLVGEGLIATLAALAAWRGRKWKKAATDAVEAGQQFKAALDKSNGKSKIAGIISGLKSQQKSNGTFDFIKQILNRI
jgi:hypothetical protein